MKVRKTFEKHNLVKYYRKMWGFLLVSISFISALQFALLLFALQLLVEHQNVASSLPYQASSTVFYIFILA